MARLTALILMVLIIAACSAALAQDNQDEKKVPIALTYEIYLPSNSTTQDVFGNSWKGIGLSAMEPQQTEKWRPMFSFNAMSSSGTNDAALYSFNYGLHKGIGRENKKAQPFVVLKGGPYYGSVEVPSLALDENKWGFNANATLGVMFSEKFVIEARYDYYSRIADFNFDGLTLSVGLKLFEL